MRLTGVSVRAARSLVHTEAGGRVATHLLMEDHGIRDLLNLDADARSPMGVHPGPLPQRHLCAWTSADRPLPDHDDPRPSAAQLHTAYRDGDTTPLEVLEKLFSGVDRRQFGHAHFSPFRTLDRDRAYRAAQASTDRYASGEPLGPLDGIPIPVKDHYAMIGLSAYCGGPSPMPSSSDDAHMVAALRQSGALLVGTTHTTEWGMDPCGYNEFFSMPRNPHRPEYAAGGSSTGAGVAVALGLSPLATGSDGGGSIRIPSALNGIVGIKPTFGRIGRSGDFFGASSVSTAGPLGLTVEDLVQFLTATTASPDLNDPIQQWGPSPSEQAGSWRKALHRGVDGARIAVPQRLWEQADPEVASQGRALLAQLQDQGAELVDVDLPILAHAPAVGVLSIGMETLANLSDLVASAPETLSDSLHINLEVLRRIDVQDFLKAQCTRRAIQETMRDLLDDVHLMALPTTASAAPPYPLSLDATAVLDDTALRQMTHFTFLANITGLPAGSVPSGTIDGLPIGLQFIGGAYDEASVFAAMAEARRLQGPLPCPRLTNPV